jgi:hypothetical protein
MDPLLEDGPCSKFDVLDPIVINKEAEEDHGNSEQR